MKTPLLAAIVATAIAASAGILPAQNNAAVAPAPTAAVAHKVNTAIVPVPRTDGSVKRQSLVLQRAKDNQGACDIAFIGDSITQGWEEIGRAHV